MVSLIITSYNYAKYVERAIRSALDQSLSDQELEIIVVNDASTDNTKEILENFVPDVRIFNLEENIGLAGARNFGIRKAKGQFIIFLDADDYLHKDMLRTQKLFLDENNALDAVSVDYYDVDERGKHIRHVNAETEPIACGIMFRKDFLHNIGLYDEKFRAREEEDLRLRWQDQYNIYNLIIPMYRYRMHDNNLTKNEEEMKKHQELLHTKHNK